MLEDIRQQYQEIQQAREAIDSQRDEWLHEQAGPFIDAMEEQLRSSSLPEGFRKEIDEMRKELVIDAYYKGIINTSDVAEFLGLDESRVRQFAREGRLGLALSRQYVFSQQDLARFAAKDRPTGVRHQK